MATVTRRYSVSVSVAVDIAEPADTATHARTETLMLAMHTFLADGTVATALRDHLASAMPDSSVEHLVVAPLEARLD